MNDLEVILPYLIGVNIVSLILMGIDKRKAKKQQYRIPERTFWMLAIIGGSFGSFLGMRLYHHKTKHRSFMVGMPVLMILHFIIFLYVIFSMS
ncbi:DUF1294 domain-containing protein [Virgibacillus byunsanensis]|uniref:DUF1294 domain-containing protein n=1 Tax=Virgibacillus byunsanensis TaxID=570945 RepID=A0ABW3LNS5_9BACI